MIVTERCPKCSCNTSLEVQCGGSHIFMCPNCDYGFLVDVTKKFILCQHKNLIMYEQIYGKTTYNKDCTKTYTDWSSNAINAHVIRVSKYFCLDCKTIINAPIYEDTQNE